VCAQFITIQKCFDMIPISSHPFIGVTLFWSTYFDQGDYKMI
jgi:hypothetical protein